MSYVAVVQKVKDNVRIILFYRRLESDEWWLPWADERKRGRRSRPQPAGLCHRAEQRDDTAKLIVKYSNNIMMQPHH